jgi:hypothetical protein
LEWDPNERDAWVIDAQRWISQIKGVLQCKIDLDSEGEISGVHVVAGMEREPRHIVRDVESLLKARLGIDVFYKKIGVVQVLENGHDDPDENLDLPSHSPASPALKVTDSAVPSAKSSAVTFHSDDDPDASDDSLMEDTVPPSEPSLEPDPEPGPELREPSSPADPIPAVLLEEGSSLRVVCSGVGVMASEMLVRAEVQLRSGDREIRGTREGANHAGSAIQLVAQATLEALAQLVNEPILLHLNEVRVDSLGDRPVVLCAVELVEGRKSETLFGSCSNGHNEQQAVVFAILDAVNRRLSLYSLKSAEAEG